MYINNYNIIHYNNICLTKRALIVCIIFITFINYRDFILYINMLIIN